MKTVIYDIETIPIGEWTPPEDSPNSIPPLTQHEIVSIGALVLNRDLSLAEARTTGGGSGEEISILSDFLNLAREQRLVDWNGNGFDVPVIQNRIFRFGLDAPWFFDRQYRTRFGEMHFDMADWWANFGASRKSRLADVASLIGLPGKVGMRGADVASAYEAGKIDDINTYCMQDTYQTAFIFLRMQYMVGEINLRYYRELVGDLLQSLEGCPEHEDFCKGIDEMRLFKA